jgi:hypothetical protein
MSRGFALFLIASGIVFGLIGTTGLVMIAVGQANMPPQATVAFVALELVAAGLITWAVRIMRRTKPIGQVTATGTVVNGYVANTPQMCEMDGSTYAVLYLPPVPGKNGRPSSLGVSTPVDAAGEFKITRETWFDRLGKRLGLALEVQTGDEEFDRECYVRSDTPEFAEAYLGDPVKRVAILDMRRLGFPDVTLKEGTISVTWVGFDPHKHDRPELTADAAARLILLGRNLPAHKPEFENRVGAHRKQWQVVLWVFLAVFALTVIGLGFYPPLSGWDLASRAALLVVVAGPVFAFVSALLLRGTSTSHYAWGGLMIGTLLLFPLGGAGTAGLLNGLQDTSPEVTHKPLIVEKYTTKSKNSTNYHVRVQSWRDPGETESFGVSQTDWTAAVPHQSKLVVVTRAGWLGVEWVVSKRVETR